MKFGYRHILRDNGEGGGGYEGGDAPSTPENDRVSALEARLGKLTQVLTATVQRDQQREQQTQQQQEHDKTLRSAQSFVSDAEAKLNAARKKLAAAHETGDGVAIADATAEVSTYAAEHTAARMHFQSLAQRPAHPQQPAQPQQTQQQVDDSNLRQWRARNSSWYGVDPEMTQAAQSAAKAIESERVLEVGSPAYFQAIDARVRKQYGDRMPQNNAAQMTSPRGNMGQRPAPTQNRIPESVAEGYRKMGINIDNPETAKQLLAARERAVEKGFLPSEPLNARVIGR